MQRRLKYFNSIKVRLKQTTNSIFFCDMRFQFHKGTIKTKEDFREEQATKYFNSIKVRLKPHKLHCWSWMLQFQFHKGTIKTQA